MRTTVCVLDPAGLAESQKFGLRKNTNCICVLVTNVIKLF